MSDHLLIGGGIFAVRETGELKGRYLTGQTETGGKLTLPFASHGITLLVIILRLRCEFQLVIALCLGRTERLRDRKHGLENPRMNRMLSFIVRRLETAMMRPVG